MLNEGVESIREKGGGSGAGFVGRVAGRAVVGKGRG